MSGYFARIRGSAEAAAAVLAVGLAALAASCQSGGDANLTPSYFRGASETIRGAGVMDVRHAIVDVMTEDGFRLASPFGDVMSFESDGTRHDEWMYGAYGSRPMRQRVTITIEVGDNPETLKLFAAGMVVREYGNLEGEESGYLFAGGRHRYGKYLRMIEARVKREQQG